MRTACLLVTLAVLPVGIPRQVPAQQVAAPQLAAPQTPARSSSRTATLNVAVEASHGVPADGLTANDFKLLDNKSPQPITSVKQVRPGTDPVNVIIVVDAVNTVFTRVAYERSEVGKYLKANGGHLAQPTTIAVVMDKGAQIQKGFSTDGNALNAGLDGTEIGLREIRRDSGIWGADERVTISLTALRQLIAYGGTIPGRKLILWISPGWPLLSGPRIDLTTKQQDQIFGDVVALTTAMQKNNVTLYNVNPLGPEESLLRADYYQSFLKGVTKPSKTDLADLSLQVLAAQSGGLVLTSSSDVAGNLAKCVADLGAWYELTFVPAPAEQPNEYHAVEITTERQGVSARTQTGYYAQP